MFIPFIATMEFMMENNTKEPVSAPAAIPTTPVSLPVVAVAPVVAATQAAPVADVKPNEEKVVASSAAAKKVAAKKPAAKKSTVKKVIATKAIAKKPVIEKAAVKKTTVKKVVAKKAVAEKVLVKKATAKKATAKKATAKKATTTEVTAKKVTAKKVTAKKVADKKPRLAKSNNPAPVVDQTTQKAKKVKLVRDSFTMPGHEYQVLQDIKKALLEAGIEIKKSELFRIGVGLLKSLSTTQLDAARAALTKLRAGRPKK